MNTYATVNGIQADPLTIEVFSRGPWLARGELVDAVDLSGPVNVRVGDLELLGNVRESRMANQRTSVLVVAGADGWSKVVSERSFQADNGVRSRTIVDGLAVDVGESVASFRVDSDRVGSHFVRQALPASSILEQLVGDSVWWVDYAGATHVGTHAEREVSGSYDVVEYDGIHDEALLVVDDLRSVSIGSVVRKVVTVPLVVKQIEITVRNATVAFRVYGKNSSPAHVMFRRLVEASLPRKTFDLMYRYRVTGENHGRYSLRPVNPKLGLPSLQRVPVMAGVSGAKAVLRNGTSVLLSFIEGDPGQPVVTHFAPEQEDEWKPISLCIEALDWVDIKAKIVRLAKGALRVAVDGTLVISYLPFIINPAAILPGVTPVAGTITGGRDDVLA